MSAVMGRPTLYSDELADKMCQVISEHAESDEDLCKMYDFFPSYRAFCNWLTKHPYMMQLYSRAKQTQVERRLDKIQTRIDDHSDDFVKDDNGRLYANNVKAQLLRINAGFNQWRAAKLLANVYGDKVVEDKVNDVRRDLDEMKLKSIRDEIEKKNV